MQSAQVPKFDFAIIACSHHEIARNKTGRPELTGRTHLTQKSQIPGRNIRQTTPSKSLGQRLWPNDKQHVQWESCLVQSASINFVGKGEGKKHAQDGQKGARNWETSSHQSSDISHPSHLFALHHWMLLTAWSWARKQRNGYSLREPSGWRTLCNRDLVSRFQRATVPEEMGLQALC